MIFNEGQSAALLKRVQEFEKEIQAEFGEKLHVNLTGQLNTVHDIDTIVRLACWANGKDASHLLKKGRTTYFVDSIRQSVCLLAQMYTEETHRGIAKAINRNKASVYHSLKAAKKFQQSNDEMFMAVFTRSLNKIISNS